MGTILTTADEYGHDVQKQAKEEMTCIDRDYSWQLLQLWLPYWRLEVS
jgi:hypothetical protein